MRLLGLKILRGYGLGGRVAFRTMIVGCFRLMNVTCTEKYQQRYLRIYISRRMFCSYKSQTRPVTDYRLQLNFDFKLCCLFWCTCGSRTLVRIAILLRTAALVVRAYSVLCTRTRIARHQTATSHEPTSQGSKLKDRAELNY